MTYVDTSVLLRWILEERGQLDPSRVGRPLSSVVANVETFRTLDRLRLTHRWPATKVGAMQARAHDLLARIRLIDLSPAILARAAEPFATPLRTLDALHLATALQWRARYPGEALSVATHDDELALAARASGLEVLP